MGLLFFALVWGGFHPSKSIAVVGPAGPKYRAFIENQSFGDISFSLSVSDWPYTLLEPISVESVLYSEGADCRIFWSADGSVIVARDSETADSSGLRATYDYLKHELIRYDKTRMQALITSRGGIGPEHQDYSDGKDWDDR